MDVRVEQLPHSRIQIVLALPWTEWQTELEHAVLHVGATTKIAGFRPGKVPQSVLEQRVGKGALLSEAAEHAITKAYQSVLKERGIVALSEPQVQLDPVKEGAALTCTLEVEVLPEITLPNDWRQTVGAVNVTAKNALAALTVTAQEIDEELDRLVKMRAKLITVNRPAAQGDSVEVDFTVRRDGVVIDGGKSEKHPVIIGSGAFIPGFEEALEGMREGEEKTFTLTFPHTYHVAHLASQKAEFTVRVRLVQERQLPALDDAFAQSLGSFASLAELRQKLEGNLLEERREKAQESHRTSILDALVGGLTVELPPQLVQREEEHMVNEFASHIQSMGGTLDEYLTRMKKTRAGLQEEWKDAARKRILAELVLSHLAEAEEITVESADIEAAMNRTLQYFKQSRDAEQDIDMERLYTATRERLRTEKVFARLMNI